MYSEVKSLRRIFYPTGKGIVMTFYKGQNVFLCRKKCIISSIIEQPMPVYSQSYTTIHVTIPSGEEFVWKKVFASGVVHEYEIDSLL